MLVAESSIISYCLVLQPPTETSYHVAKAQTNPTSSLWRVLFTIQGLTGSPTPKCVV